LTPRAARYQSESRREASLSSHPVRLAALPRSGAPCV